MDSERSSKEQFDVIIVGGGPAGLKCAHTLSDSGLSILLLEKESIFGDKLCAGGLTANDLRILDIPDEIIEHKISNTALHSPKRKSSTQAQAPFLYTVNRKILGAWQKSLLDNTPVVVRRNSRVSKINNDHVILIDERKISYKYLIGADGQSSIVRKHLGIPVNKKLIGIQYTIPVKDLDPRLEIHLDSRLFKSWYAWIFPHEKSVAIGCCSNPKILPPARLRDNFHQWLDMKNIAYSEGKLETYPISYDYRGVRFDNIYLIGEAAGMASGLTGEGIYQSLVSGQEVARMIIDPDYVPDQLDKVLRYNAIQHKFLGLFNWSHALRNFLHELLLMAMNNNRVKGFIRSAFSPAKKK